MITSLPGLVSCPGARWKGTTAPGVRLVRCSAAGLNNDGDTTDKPVTAPGNKQQGSSPPSRQLPGGAQWALMGRMVPSSQIALSREQKQVLITSAAARMSGLDTEAFDAQLQELLTLLPDLRSLVVSLKPSVLVELAGDTRGVAAKLISLRTLFPDANVSMLVAKRPTLLTAAEWPAVVAAHAKLHAMFPEGGVDHMVMQQPLLLVEDVDNVVGELERLMPGVDVRLMLLRNPSVVTQVQRGTSGLGPGAEFVGGIDWL